MLNTTFHTKEQIALAEKIINEEITFDAGTTDREKEAYMSILIFCDFDKEAASKYYRKLKQNGILLFSDMFPFESSYGDLCGWVLE